VQRAFGRVRPRRGLQEGTNTGARRGTKAPRQVSADPGSQPGERKNDVAILECSDFTSLRRLPSSFNRLPLLPSPPWGTCKECMVFASEALEKRDSDSVV
jgi:hypothetical protein